MTVIPPFDGVIRQHQQDEHIAWAMLPCACPQNHAANLLPLDDGSLMCVWFGGSQEGKADISIWGSRLAPGSDRWSEAVKLCDDPDRSEQNPVLFQAPDNVLWLLWTAQFAGNQDTVHCALPPLPRWRTKLGGHRYAAGSAGYLYSPANKRYV